MRQSAVQRTRPLTRPPGPQPDPSYVQQRAPSCGSRNGRAPPSRGPGGNGLRSGERFRRDLISAIVQVASSPGERPGCPRGCISLRSIHRPTVRRAGLAPTSPWYRADCPAARPTPSGMGPAHRSGDGRTRAPPLAAAASELAPGTSDSHAAAPRITKIQDQVKLSTPARRARFQMSESGLHPDIRYSFVI